MTPANEFPGNIIFVLIFFGFMAFFAWSMFVRARWLFAAKPLNRLDNIFWRLAGLVPWLLGNARVTRRGYWYSGVLHSLIWWGFLILQIRTLNFLLNGIDHSISLEALVPSLYDVLRPVMDTFNILVIVGIAMAAFQRIVWKPKRMSLNIDGWMTLFFIFWLMVTDIMVNSFEFYLHPELFENPQLSYVAYGFSQLWGELGMSTGTAEALNTFFWYNHLIDFLAFLAFLPYSKHSHVLVVVPQIFLRRHEPTGVMEPIKNIEEAETFGAGKLTDFNWKQLLDPFNCTECGRCTEVCPAHITGKLLSPKQYIVDIRHMLDDEIPPARFWMKKEGASNGDGEAAVPMTTSDAVGFEQTWDCVTCGACMEACPVFIEHVPTIMDVRRFMVMEQSNMPETAQATLMQLEQRGHPWRGTQLTRTTWIEEMAAEGTEVPLFDGSQEYLYWVGCSGALQERNVKVTKALVRLFLQAGVSFGVLATEEGCSGDPARRLGNEYLYQMQAKQNIELMNAKGVQKVVANCPHCYNTIKHEYPDFEGTYETVHHTELLAQLVRSGKLPAQQANGLQDKTVTYHDPCYTARHNDIIDEPRQVIAAVGSNQVEMPRCKRGTFCCGAGGGHMWVEENRGERINDVRTKEAVDTGADVIAVACPFCMQMFESGVGSVPAAAERGVQVFDIAELLDMSVAYSKPLAPNGNGGAPPAPAEPESVAASDAPPEGEAPQPGDETTA